MKSPNSLRATVNQADKPVLVRITTLPVSMKVLLKGQMRFMQHQGFDVIMISADGPEVNQLVEQEKCRHIVIPLTRNISPVKDLISLLKLYKVLRKLKADIVHTHTPKAGLIGMWAAWFAGVPVRLHTIAGLPWMEYKGAMKKLLILMERLTCSAAHGVYPNSKHQYEFLRKAGIGKDKMKVLGKGSSNGIDTGYFSVSDDIEFESQKLRKSEQVGDEEWVWIFIGRIVKDKGIGEILDAFEKLQLLFPNDRLWLLGEEEPLLDPLTEEQIRRIHRNPNIRSWGFVKDVRMHLHASQVLVFPSYREGFPNVPMQAGAMGCSLILSDINGCNEIVEHGVNGLLVPVKDPAALYKAMFELRSDPEKADNFARAIGEKIRSSYNQSKLWKLILEEYTSWLKKKKRPLPQHEPVLQEIR